MDTNNHSSDCGFGERLVSYLYDEAVGAEKAAIEMHLDKCAVCAEEFAAMSGVQFAVSDWKKREFDALPTPAISIPYAPTGTPQRAVAPDATDTWLSALRNLFTLSPAWSLTAASIAVFLMVGAIGLISLTKRGDEVAGGANVKVTPAPSASSAVSQPTPPSTPVKKDDSVTGPAKPTPAATPDASKSGAVKVSPRPPVRTASTDGPAKQVKRQSKPDVREQESAVSDDEEDDGLRLAELFDEIGMR